MSCEDFRGYSSQACHLWQLCSLIILTSLSMAFVDVGPSVDTVDPSYPTYLCLELPGQPWDQPWGVTPYEVLPSRLNRLLYGNLTLSESTSENGSEDYGSSGSGDVVELNGSPSSNVAIRPPPGLSQDIGEVAKVYPSHSFGHQAARCRKMPKDAARCRKQRNFQNFICHHLQRLRPGEACRLRACPSLNRPQW